MGDASKELELCLLHVPEQVSCVFALCYIFFCPHEIPIDSLFSFPTLFSSKAFDVSYPLQQFSSSPSVTPPALKPTRSFFPRWLCHLQELAWTSGLQSLPPELRSTALKPGVTWCALVAPPGWSLPSPA